jgi:hypothetical protein
MKELIHGKWNIDETQFNEGIGNMGNDKCNFNAKKFGSW